MDLSAYEYGVGSIAHQYIGYDDSYYIGEVKMILPTSEKTHFHSILAVDMSNAVIRNSNSFLVDPYFYTRKDNCASIVEYDDILGGTRVYRRINATYQYLTTHPVEEVVDREMFLLCNPFSATNIGHDLSIMFDRITEYKARGLTIPVVLAEAMLECPRSIEVCQILLPTTEIYYLPSDKVVQFKCLHISKNVILDITRHDSIIKTLITNVTNDPVIVDTFKSKKIILIKTNRNKIVVSKWSCYNATKFIDTLVNERGWICINPEEMHMKEIIAYLYYADIGAISYAHVTHRLNAIIYALLIISIQYQHLQI